MKWFLFFLVFLVFRFSSGEAQEKWPCIVDGHGPYDETRESCLALGRDQARVNCILHEKESTVEYHVGQESGTCRALIKNRECQRGVCSKSASSRDLQPAHGPVQQHLQPSSQPSNQSKKKASREKT